MNNRIILTAIQELRILTKTAEGVTTQRSLPVRFVPMVKPPPGA